MGDLAAFSVRQEADLAVCNDRRQALVDIIDAHGRLVAPRPWYRRMLHRNSANQAQVRSEPPH